MACRETRDFRIEKTHTGFIVVNKRKPFKDGHTHVDTYKQANLLVELSIKEIVPERLSYYLMHSMVRINRGKYQERLIEQEKILRRRRNKSRK